MTDSSQKNLDLFPAEEKVWLDMPDGHVVYQPRFLGATEADALLDELAQHLAWRQDQIKIYGRWVNIPRLQAWYGDAKAHYHYSGLSLEPQPFPQTLNQLKQKIEEESGYSFNAVLANYYRNGQDTMGWHSDNEKELGRNPVIASISLGHPRRFQFKHRQNKALRREVKLANGSLLLMAGATQHHWLHGIPKEAKIAEPRINLTFRYIHTE